MRCPTTSRSVPTAVRWSADRRRTIPPTLTVADERRRMVLSALATLPPDQRAALVLVDMEGYSVAEAAQMLDCAAGTVKSRCSRGRAQLAALLGVLAPTGGDPDPRPGEPAARRARPIHWSPRGPPAAG